MYLFFGLVLVCGLWYFGMILGVCVGIGLGIGVGIGIGIGVWSLVIVSGVGIG